MKAIPAPATVRRHLGHLLRKTDMLRALLRLSERKARYEQQVGTGQDGGPRGLLRPERGHSPRLARKTTTAPSRDVGDVEQQEGG